MPHRNEASGASVLSLALHAGACTLMGQLDAELVVAELHRGGDDKRIEASGTC
ncbi:hypothetical protein OHA98_21375 [Streptomyces sp. NBC_00654]|uniref:hypothetical protein n=1 Tax=Streptomyces sp. NBC_00654 TaxID=2975799 RepID=UPI002256E241|nr:hypothetical protein [Streptomyces sp. NBC_00654]MCX4967270.1 hypothetical protein [Streptomyces sp. NBC_00654]